MQVALRSIAAALLLCGGAVVVFAQDLWLRQPDGKIVTVIDDKGVGGPLQQWIERRNPDGSLDLAFGSNGRVTFSLASADILEPRSLSLDAQGRLILSGTVAGVSDRSAAAVSRFLPDGRADLRWGTQGTSLVGSRSGDAQATDALAMPDQGTLLLGQLDAAGSPKAVLWRLRPDGTADASFGQSGVVHLAPLDTAEPTSLLLDEDGSVVIGSQRARAGALLLEAHRWQQGQEVVHLVARQVAPSGWRGPATLDRRDGRWQWTDAAVAGALALVLINDAHSASTATMGKALFNPFAPRDVMPSPAPQSALDGSVAPGLGWMWLLPAAAVLGVVVWRWRLSARATDLGLIDSRAAMLDAAMTDLARLTPAAVDDRPPQRATVADSEAKLPACRNGLERPMFGPPDDLKRIKGIGPVLEKRLHGEGIFYFWQIAQWRPEDVAGVGARLSGFKDRIERDRWVAQAVELSS